MNIIETQNLTKSYADFTAVSNVNLHIQAGTPPRMMVLTARSLFSAVQL